MCSTVVFVLTSSSKKLNNLITKARTKQSRMKSCVLVILLVTLFTGSALGEGSTAELAHTVRARDCILAAMREIQPSSRLSLINDCINPLDCALALCPTNTKCINGRCIQLDTCATIYCGPGYRCYQGACRKVMGCGEKCDYPKWICSIGATCKHGKCTGSNADESSPCSSSSCCKPGARCYLGTCRKEMGAGQACDYPKWICKLGLSCIKRVCTFPIIHPPCLGCPKILPVAE